MTKAQITVKAIRTWLEKKELTETVDMTLLDLLSDSLELYLTAKADVKKNGITVQFGAGPAQNPALKALQTERKNIISLADRLGLSPRSRRMMKVGAEEYEPSPLDKLLEDADD